MAVPQQNLDAVFREAIVRERAARAAKAQADAEARAAAEAEYERTRSRSGGEVAQDVGAQVTQGVVGLGQSLYGAANYTSAGLLDRVFNQSQRFQQTQDILQSAKSTPTQLRSAEASRVFADEGVLSGVGEYVTDPALLQDLIIPSLVSLAPTVAASRFAGTTALRAATAPGANLTDDAIAKLVADRSTTAALRTAGIQSGGSANVEGINRAREAGATEGEAQAAGLGAATIAGVAVPAISRLTGAARLEAGVANRLFGGPTASAPAAATLLRGTAAGAAREGIDETLQSGVEQAATNVFAPGVDVLEGVPEAAALGGIAGTPLGAGLGAASSRKTVRRDTPLRRSIEADVAAQTAEAGIKMDRPLRPKPTVDLQAAIDQRVTAPASGITEADLLSAQDVDNVQQERTARAVANYLFNTDTNPDGSVKYTRYNPELQVLEDVPEADALETARAVAAQAESDTAPAGLPQVEELPIEDIEAAGIPAATPADDLPLPNVVEGEVENIDIDQLPGAPPAVSRAPLVPPGQLQEFINQRTGVSSQLSARERVTAEDLALNELFTVATDPVSGEPTYSRYNADLQRMEEVEPAAAKREAKARVKEEQAAAAEAERIANLPPTTGWKQRLSKELGISPSSMRGQAWQAFSAAVTTANVRPGDPNAAEFLSTVAPLIGADPARAGTFASKLAEKYAPEPDVQDVAPAASEGSTDATAPKAESTAKQAEVIAEAPAVSQVAPDAKPGDAVPVDTAPVDSGSAKAINTLDRRVQRIAADIARDNPDVATKEALLDVMYDSSTATELDELFSVLKLTPTFKATPAAEQDEVTQVFSDLYDEMESAGRFQRTPGKRTGGLGLNEFNELITAARGNNPRQVPIIGHQTVAEYRQYTGRQAPNDVQGVFTEDGTVHLIRRNLKDKHDFAMVLAHEMGHGGVRGLLGNSLAPVINRLHANAAVRKRIEAKRQTLGGINRITAGEEVLADMVAGGEKLTGDVTSKIRSAIAQGAARILGVGDLRVSDADVDMLLTDTVAYMRGRHINQSPKLADAVANIALDKVVGDPSATLEAAVHSRAITELEGIVNALPGDEAAPNTTMSQVSEKATTAGRRVMAAMTSGSTGKGSTKVFRAALHALPLAQIHNLYSKLFDGPSGDNHLSALLQEVRRHGARHNQLLTRARKVTYDNESFNVSPLELARDWEKLGKKDKGAFDALNAMQQYATLYKLWPDKPLSAQPDVDYAAVGFTQADRVKAHGLIKTLWTKAGPAGQQIYKQSQGDYKAQWGARFDALAAELSRTTGIPRFLPDGSKNPEFQSKYGSMIDASLHRISSGPYSPLSRYGDYFTVVRDGEGNLLEFMGSDTLAEANQKAASVRSGVKDYKGEITVNVSVRDEFIGRLDGVNHKVLRNFEESVKSNIPEDTDPNVVNGLISGLREAYLQSLPKHSIMSHANQRKGVEGFTLDAFRAYNDYTLKAAKATADYDHNGNISRNLLGMATQVREAGKTDQDSDTTTMGHVYQAVKTQRDAFLRAEFSPVADWIGQAGFLQYMTSPSQMVVNAMQTPMVAIPRLAARFNSAGAIREAKNGLVAFIKSKGDLLGDKSVVSDDMKRVLGRLQEAGVLDFTFAHDMAGLADGGFSHMSGHWRGAMEVLSFAMHRSEVFNRQVTAYAAAELAAVEVRKNNGIPPGGTLPDELIEQVAQIAEQSVYDSHYDYSSANRATMMQGPYRKLLFQFQSYRVNALAMMYKDFRDSLFTKGLTKAEVASARRGLGWLLGMQLAFTGAAGTVMAPLVFALLDLFRDDDDLLDSRTEFVRSAPQWLAHGVLSGVVDTGRLDSGSLLPYFGEKAYAPKDASTKDTVMYHLSRNLGPWVGLVSAWSEMGAKMAEGEPVKAMEAGLPKPFADAVKAVSGTNGVEDARGVTYFEPGVWSTVAQAVGLRSGSRRETEELRGASYQLARRVSVTKSRYLGRVALGVSTGDNGMVQDAYADIQRWNQEFPDMAISGSDIQRSIASRYKSQVMTDLFGIPTNKPPTASAVEALNL